MYCYGFKLECAKFKIFETSDLHYIDHYVILHHYRTEFSYLNNAEFLSLGKLKFSMFFKQSCFAFNIVFGSLREECTEEVRQMEEKNESLAKEKSELLKKLEIADKEVEEQKEANTRAPTRTIKNLVEKLKNDLAIKDKELQVLFTLHVSSGSSLDLI